jgi:hypothetical protein
MIGSEDSLKSAKEESEDLSKQMKAKRDEVLKGLQTLNELQGEAGVCKLGKDDDIMCGTEALSQFIFNIDLAHDCVLAMPVAGNVVSTLSLIEINIHAFKRLSEIGPNDSAENKELKACEIYSDHFKCANVKSFFKYNVAPTKFGESQWIIYAFSHSDLADANIIAGQGNVRNILGKFIISTFNDALTSQTAAE